MPEEIREDEEPEVEGHTFAGDRVDKVEAAGEGHHEDDSDDVEGHLLGEGIVTPGTVGEGSVSEG